MSIDSAFKTGELNDYSVCAVIGEFQGGFFLLQVLRGKYAYPQLKATMLQMAEMWKPSAVLIEDKASGQSLLQDLQQSTRLPVVAEPALGDKLTRAHVVVPTWEAGRVFARDGATFLPDMLTELHSFPKGSHDDQVDAITQGIRYLLKNAPGAGIMTFMQKLAGAANDPQQPTKYRFVSDRPEARSATSISLAAQIAAQRGH